MPAPTMSIFLTHWDRHVVVVIDVEDLECLSQAAEELRLPTLPAQRPPSAALFHGTRSRRSAGLHDLPRLS